MDFELSAEQKEVKRAAFEFAKGEFDKEVALELSKTHAFPHEIHKKACKLGFIGMHYPETYGGQGYGIFENGLMVEEFCRQDSSIGIALSICNFASEIILRFGNEEQKKKYLIPLAKGETISAGAFTEPDHGSDITQMFTTGTLGNGEFIINGTKTFISNGTIAKFAIVLCQTDSNIKPPYRGQSTILVETGLEGFEITDVGEKMGIKMSPTTEMSFNNVKVPKENLIGELQRGFYNVLEFFDESRVLVGAQGLGITNGAFDRALDYTKKRTQFGKKLVDFQITQHKLADMATKIEVARLLVYKAGWNFDHKGIDPKLTSMAKMFAARVAVEVADEAIQMLGGYGYITEYEVERFYRDAKITEIYEGTREIQKNTIASYLIGKNK